MLISSEKTEIKINTGKVVLKFDTAGKVRFNWLSQPNGINLLNKFGVPDSLWQLVLKNNQGKERVITSENSELLEINYGNGSERNANSNQAKVMFSWKSQISKGESGMVNMTIRCKTGNPITYWSLNANLPTGWYVIQADFPIIQNLRLKKNSKIAVPHGWGIEYDLKPGFVYESVYPYCQTVMQFISIYAQNTGLYLGAHDPNANMKQFYVKAEKSKVKFKVTNWAGIPKKPGASYKSPYEFAIGVYNGDYYEAARFYREFTFKTPWGNKQSVSKRHTPDWLKKTVLWLRPKGVEKNTVEITKQALAYFEVPTALHWYRWHVIPFDTLYPEYFPAKPDFPKAVKKMQKLGTYVMPYINGRLWDPASKSWKSEYAKETTAALKENGELYIEVYGSKVPLAVMCPYTEPWQRKVKQLVEMLVDEIGVDGVYIDQIGAAAAVKCYNRRHGHPVGGGSFWHEGYREMLTRIRKNLPKNRMLTTEENIETWLDQFDAMLLVNTHTNTGKLIPLYPAVYSDRIILFAFQHFPADDLDRVVPYRAKVAQCFLWGSQLGWIEPERIMDPKYRREAEFLKTLSKTRRFGLNLLNSGQFLGLLEVAGDNPRVKGTGTGTFGGTYKIDLPAVMAAGWLAKDGTFGILIVNQTDKDHKIQINLPLEKAGVPKNKPVALKIFGHDGLESIQIIKPTFQRLNIPARSAKILQITRN